MSILIDEQGNWNFEFSEHRNEEAIFSEALEVLLSRKKDSFKYPAPQTMSYKEIEMIFKEKLNQIIE
ncbi:MAG: hypothetical protein EWV82_01185 [Microcystis aeruginosa Ma_AC_P_19900807_S299]|nr:MAG: hypothetical protein EWV82_01185 [Microcystis aeruginosa Ma_AC_P_19900807_S299]